MAEAQLRTQLSAAIGGAHSQRTRPVYMDNIRQWSNSVTPPPTNGRVHTSRKTRATKGSSLVPTPTTQTTPLPRLSVPPVASTSQLQPMGPTLPFRSQGRDMFPQPPPITPTTQAMHTTYPSRLRTGATLLMQPIFASASSTAVAARTTRRGGVVNYAEPGSGDEFPDAGAIDSDDSDFPGGGGGTRSTARNARLSSRAPAGAGVFSATITPGTPVGPSNQLSKSELDQSYLGMIPPERYITFKPVPPTKLDYYSPDSLELQARRPTSLVPIRVEFETETHRIRDCFVWNLHEELIDPEAFARQFCIDLDLPIAPWAETVANQIRAQIEDHEGVASMEFDLDAMGIYGPGEEEIPECRVILSIDVQIATYHLLDHIEWDLLSPLTPETFAATLCADLGLSGEAVPLVAHAIHEELIKHKRDAIEWGVLGGDTTEEAPDKPRDRSGYGLVKDKTGLGLGWGRAPKDGRGPKPLRSVWRDWQEAEEFRTRFEVLTAEEVERREIERERATRRLRRETSKFQSQAAAARRRR